MSEGRGLRIGGYVSGGLLIFFGIAVIVLGVWGFKFTRDHIEREGISFGPIEDPAVAEHAPDWAGEPVDTGRKALAQAEIMREHTLSGTGGLTYAEMGRYQSAANPDDPAGTNDEAAAAKDESGQPISNSARNTWVTETALATALDMGFMSEMLSIFSIVVGIALLLTGIGLVILAKAVFGRRSAETKGRLPPPSREQLPDRHSPLTGRGGKRGYGVCRSRRSTRQAPMRSTQSATAATTTTPTGSAQLRSGRSRAGTEQVPERVEPGRERVQAAHEISRCRHSGRRSIARARLGNAAPAAARSSRRRSEDGRATIARPRAPTRGRGRQPGRARRSQSRPRAQATTISKATAAPFHRSTDGLRVRECQLEPPRLLLARERSRARAMARRAGGSTMRLKSSTSRYPAPVVMLAPCTPKSTAFRASG